MLYKKNDAKKFSIPGGTNGLIYPSSPNKDQTIAHVMINGFYPEKGYSINDVCTETIFVVEGEIDVEIDGVWNKLIKNDLIMIFPNKKYRIKGNGEVLDFITPSWEKNNNKIIKNI